MVQLPSWFRWPWMPSQKQWEGLVTVVDDIKTMVGNLDVAVAAVSKGVADMAAQITALEAGGGISASDAASLQASLADLTTQVSTLTTTAATAEADATPPAAPAAGA